jgi:hypothetical protein
MDTFPGAACSNVRHVRQAHLDQSAITICLRLLLPLGSLYVSQIHYEGAPSHRER